MVFISSNKGIIAGREKSKEVYTHSCTLIPGGVNSPVRSFPGLEMTPLIVDRGQGDMLWDVDDNSYIDFCGSWGALIHGHAHPKICEAACTQVQRGSSFGIATDCERRIAAKIASHLPSVEKIRFVSSGTEATMSAVRLSRGFTGRSLIVKFSGCYHGHVDSLLLRAGSGAHFLNSEATSKGIPKELIQHTVSLPFNDTEACFKFLKQNRDVAAVLIEPIAGNMGVVPARLDFLEMLRSVTQESGALLVFDEVISGFRVGLQGAQGIYGITPDLSCFGKVIGAGFPAAAFGGRAEIMDHLAPLGQVYQAGTLSGNPVAMEAGLAALELLEKPGFFERLEKKTDLITAPIKELILERGLNACVNQVGSMFTLFFGPKKVGSLSDLQVASTPAFQRFFLHLFEEGIYFPPSPFESAFVSMAHTEEHLLYTRDCILNFLRE